MLMENERKLIVEYGKLLVTKGLTTGTGGNISIFDKEKKYFAISPSGIDYFETEPEDVVIMDLDGKVVEGERKPSSEWMMHLIFYKKRDDVEAVVHTHSRFSSTISCMRWDIPALHYYVAFAGKTIPCAKYASYGTQELADNAFEGMGEGKAALLANHGLITIGRSVKEAFLVAEMSEEMAEYYYRTKSIGEPVLLDEEEMESMLLRFKSYGQ
ncbi:L-fuculose phosphate aldolase [Sebaldella termitidis]|jgi:L-fuculose-phosphate aldolase|uniref:Class II aldolase/adducin family protein n=1 Tax=Sebaldella termitidis (strain ATCC 33386 / NCTC 11300) TaxID=526218 RepID=D1AIW6_SEBTE|nr:L-fuculose-phosphate aldolase [Sebaldella termitidis]ACZ06928.1 class II aldolase/adducin family protein [Sebaldella termitidis ATCC 33386]MBP7979819.1 L-fuculose-phosphate aldolase [Sebaldella sp.]SUI22216.1 L-fuculose phosphate aldolase [Sebaldella termitidis]